MNKIPVAVLIPAYNPCPRLLDLLDSLRKDGSFASIIVINDGSSSLNSAPVFAEIKTMKDVHLIEHAVNKGKGAALKTGMEYIYMAHPDFAGTVTADADGQHTPEDIKAVAKKLVESHNKLILGARAFDKDVPLRSMIGNKTTRFLMKLVLGIGITDTQTGLRGIPRMLIPDLLEIPFNRYEYEMEMLLAATRNKIALEEVPITTVYLDDNASSHFNPLFDSAKIYFVMFRYVIASVITALVDYIVFASVVTCLTMTTMEATYISRFVALFVNYLLVRNLVFSSRESVAKTFPKYLLLVVISGFISGATVNYLETFGISILLGKLIAEALLYLANFVIQKDLVFSQSGKEKKTDWDRYYSRPYKTAAYSRKIVSARLIAMLKANLKGIEKPEIAELGGANSCFFEAIRNEVKPAKYYILDNNELGLKKFTERIKDAHEVSLHKADVLNMQLPPLKADIVFSVGLIEHFDKDNTARAIHSHFELLKPGGVAIILFPTPTFLYNATRFMAEVMHLWIFHDERPLKLDEVKSVCNLYGKMEKSSIIWPIFLTQYAVVVRKNK